ncbi:uncharacterized protein KRP23_4602 [Phytophthora ramorum]|uniref:uncharacterized protein n=1 Tax=Phytophthora ramorum TaxID=164328 RepID=UPI0030A08EBE|nr:hypothetical protein KRP23_4602 [Phytophthora ramorum]
MRQRLQEFQETLHDGEPDAVRWALRWDEFKTDLPKETLAIIKQRRKTARTTYKQRIKRLMKQEARIREAAEGKEPTVDSITDNLDALTLTPGTGGTPLQRVRHALTECSRQRAVTQQRRLFSAGGHKAGKSINSMFTRVSTKCYCGLCEGSVREVVVVLGITRTFALASGLRLNEAKTLVIALNPSAVATTTDLPAPLKVQALTELSRYMGVFVGSLPDGDYTWKLTRTQLVTRLALASRKTMTVDQRSMVLMAVVIPKGLFVGRHQWPSRETVASFQPASSSATTATTYISPRHTGPTWHGKRYRASLWTTGIQVRTSYGGVDLNPHKADMVRALHCLSYFRGTVGLHWRGSRLEVNTEPLRGALCQRYTDVEAGLYGTFCVEWMPYLVISEMCLYSETGTVINLNTRFRKLGGRGLMIKELVHWKWTSRGNIVVTVLLQRVTTAAQRQIGYLMQLLLLNFPQIAEDW